MANEERTPRERIARETKASASRLEKTLRTYSSWLAGALPAIASTASLFKDTITLGGAATVGLACTLLGIGVARLTRPEHETVLRLYFDAQDVVKEADEAGQSLKNEQEQRAAIEAEVDRLSSADVVVEGFWTAVGQLMSATGARPPIEEAVDGVLGLLVRDRAALFGMNGDEVWNFAVYGYIKSADQLVPLWRKKDDRHPSGSGLGRSFPPGDGHVGFAFTKSQEIYTGDATTGEARQISAIKSGENRAYDDTAYRSFASIPIIAFDTTLPRSIGVLVATSSQTGRFDRFNGRVLVHAAKALALLFTKYDLSSVSISTPAQEGPNG